MKQFALLLAIGVVGSVVAAPGDPSQAGLFANKDEDRKNRETAPYEVISEHGIYEIRKYTAAKWVSKSAETYDILDGPQSSRSFWSLFRYISGANADKVKIKMTSPVTRAIYPGDNNADKSKFTMSFYLEEKFQENPPKPTEEGVYIEDRKEMMVAAIRYSGWNDDATMIKNAKSLFKALAKDNVKGVTYEPYYSVGYDSPMVAPEQRRNEIWAVLDQ